MKKIMYSILLFISCMSSVTAQNVFSNMAASYADNGNYEMAIEYEKKSLDMIQGIKGKFCIDYASSLSYIANYYNYLGHYQESIRFGTEVMQIFREVLGDRHPDYAKSLGNLANYNCSLGNYTEAVRLGTEAMQIHREVLGNRHPDYAISLGNLANYNCLLGNYTEAVRFGTEVMQIFREVLGDRHPDYAKSLGNLAYYESLLGNYTEAVRLGTEAMQIHREVLGNRHPDYAKLLGNLANYNCSLGNYTEAVRLGTEAMQIRREMLGDRHPDYAISLGSLANYNCSLGNYTEAVRLGTEAMQIRREMLGERNPDYAISLGNLAYYESLLGNYTEAVRLGTEAMQILREVLGDRHPDYAKLLGHLASYNYSLGNYTEAVRLGTEAMQIRREMLGDRHPDYLAICLHLIDYYNSIDNNKVIETLLVTTIPQLQQLILSNFLYLTSGERKQFWNKYNHYFRNFYYIAESILSNDIIRLGYDMALFSKGILLNSEQEFNKFLTKTGSEDLQSKYNEIVDLQFQLNKLYEKPVSERYCDTDSLERHVNELERKLMNESSEFGEYTRNLAIKWEDIRENLKEKDVAIEFVSFPSNNNITMYIAYILRPNTEVPKLVKLFEEKELSSLTEEELYSKTSGSELLWAKLQPELDGVENVYFAPDGILHQTGIEYFPDFDDSNKLISDRYNLHRLSSTRQLALKKKSTEGTDAVIYGGIQYNTEPETMLAESKKYEVSESRGFQPWYNLSDSLSMRTGIKYLPFTLLEASLVKEMFEHVRQEPLLMTGNEATEESFRNLSGTNKNVLHIATHGFYWEEDEAERRAQTNKRLIFMSQSGDNIYRNVEDKALTRTGLFMAGANNALSGKELPENVDDGILTAQEIANLDLRSLDLVVLSACQTGMGDISSDGVFGLQRGFKKAGANSILMSLWDVDDEATQILMTEFYRNYLAGQSKRKSLQKAQKAVREDPRFKDPEYWAAFILLDALN